MSTKGNKTTGGSSRKVDPKVKNLFIFVTTRLGSVVGFCYGFIWCTNERDPMRLVAYLTIGILVWRICLSIYRRLIVPAKEPLAYGKWAIVTGSTSGIGKEFAEELARRGMSIMLISRNKTSLAEQAAELTERFKVDTKYMVYNFGEEQFGPVKDAFYSQLHKECTGMNADGGLGLLINNVGVNEDHPMLFDEFDDKAIYNMINCNIHSITWMTQTVMKYMKERKNGGVVTISSGSASYPAPYNVLYSATKAFSVQFSRSLHVENWGTGVDFYVVTPFYIVSNLFKRKSGTIVAPMPAALVSGTLSQLGKKWVWQGHGYWFHGLLGNAALYFWGTTERWRKMMVDNRARWEEKQAQLKETAAGDKED